MKRFSPRNLTTKMFPVVLLCSCCFVSGLRAQVGGTTQTLTVGGMGLTTERVQEIRGVLEEARFELEKLRRLKAKGGRCQAVKERAELIGGKTDLKLERALMMLRGGAETATVNVHVNVPDPQPQVPEAVILLPPPV